MVSCSSIIGRTFFESYSEFYLALCIGFSCGIEGKVLDMSMMAIDPEMLPQEELDYFKYLVSLGYIYIGTEVNKSDVGYPILAIDGEGFLKIVPKMFYKCGDYSCSWSFEYAVREYEGICNELVTFDKIKSTLMHVVAYRVLQMYLGNVQKDYIHIQITELKAINPYLYVNLLSCRKTLLWLRDVLILVIDFSSVTVDIDYSIFCNNATAAGHIKFWTIDEKRSFMKKEGIVPGSIVVLWRRKRMCASNPIGHLVSSSIVRVDEILPSEIAVTTIAISKTKEEIIEDYESIPEDRQHIFTDLLYAKPNQSSHMLSLYDTGIQDYFMEESEFLAKLDKYESVTKKITVDGVTKEVEMSEVDAIYWLLCQFDIDFNDKLYRDMYNNGEELLWDKYGEPFEIG